MNEAEEKFRHKVNDNKGGTVVGKLDTIGGVNRRREVGSVLDTTSRDPPPSSKVCETSLAQYTGRGGGPPLSKSVHN